MGDELELNFLNSAREKIDFHDQDYNEGNKNLNRLKKYTFARPAHYSP